jgi:hypothetical protein
MDSVPRTILKEFEEKSGLKLGKAVRGTGCLIFNLKDYPNRVVKIVGDCFCASHILETIKKIKSLKRIPVVKVFQYGALSNNYYYYVMGRLKKIKSAIWFREMDDYQFGPEQYLYYDCKLNSLSPKVKSFFKAVRAARTKHRLYYSDLHIGNIMKNSHGVMKFIDLESF